MKSVKYIGLDVHQATISIAVLDANGKLVMQSVSFFVSTVQSLGTTLDSCRKLNPCLG